MHAVRILQHCVAGNLGCWIGGKFETGIGRIANLRYAACRPLASAHDLSPGSRYFHEDIVLNPLTMDPDGHIAIGAPPR